MASKKIKSVDLLPEFFRTEKNEKFLSSTIDQLIQPPALERIEGYIGSKSTPNYASTSDVYIAESLPLRRNYQLEPALVVKNSLGDVQDVIGIDDLTNEISRNGGSVENFDRLYRSKFYSFDPHIDWDKFVNYQEYFWLVNGPEPVVLYGQQITSTSTFSVRDSDSGGAFIFTPDGVSQDPIISLYRGNTYIFDVNSANKFYIKTQPTVGEWDQLPGVINNGTQTGLVTLVVDESTPTNLFYISDDDYQSQGQFVVRSPEENSSINVEFEIVGKKSYISANGLSLINGMKVRFGGQVFPEYYRDKFFFVEGVGTEIKLINLANLDSPEKVATQFNDKFDENKFDDYAFDEWNNLPVQPEYITINRSSRDLNPWSRYNRWVHKDVIAVSAAANGVQPVYPNSNRARRPIIEFKPDLKLFNFGSKGIQNVDLIDNITEDVLSFVEGSAGHRVDGYLLEQGQRVIFLADTDSNVKDKIYEVKYILAEGKLRLTLLAVDTVPANGVVSVLKGKQYKGTSWWYNGEKWIFAQQRTTLNQAPLFDLFDSNGRSYADLTYYLSDFKGNEIFTYERGAGSKDSVLGFPLKYKNSYGTGSYLFKNYFMTESINISENNQVTKTVKTANTFLKYSREHGDDFVNIWTKAQNYPIPLLGSDDNKFYEAPLGITNNPLNGPISDLTFSEINDHIKVATQKHPDFQGIFPGQSNLREITNISSYANRLISHSNPLAFAQFFLGKIEHNVINALSISADQYNQFKLSFFKKISELGIQDDPVKAVDLALKEMNVDKDVQTPYYLSDMVAYGNDKIIRKWSVTSINNKVYPLQSDFDLTSLSLRSVLVYLNDEQLVHGKDYIFVSDDSSIELLCNLTVGDIITVNDYNSTEGCFIPPTPSKLGLYPKFKPQIFLDKTYLNPTTVIQGHDGSIMTAYGDYRDYVILELEKRIYNNIKVEYNQLLLDVNSVNLGAFRSNKFTDFEINNIIRKDFIKWSGSYGIDSNKNTTFDENQNLTWNYTGSFNSTIGTNFKGSWRAIYKFLYDTETPDQTPWEMLGFFDKPTWWDDEYGPAPYTSGNLPLWEDIESGTIRQGDRAGIDLFYARPGIADIMPVDSGGDLITIDQIVTNITEFSKRQNWKLGDHGPAETAWRRSSYWPFVVQKLLALTNPVDYASLMYDPKNTQKNIAGQWTYGNDYQFLSLRNVPIFSDNNTLLSGYSVFVSEVGLQKDKNYITQLKSDLSFVDYNLFYKVGGFINKNKLQIIVDAIDPTSASPGALLPPEDYNLILNVSNPVKTTSISGIIIQKNNGKFTIKGYDTTNPYFTVLPPIRNSVTPSITVGGVSEPFVVWNSSSNTQGSNLNSLEAVTVSSSTAGTFYQKGQIVKYDGKYYRVIVDHRSGNFFESEYFQSMPFLPIKGGSTVQSAIRFESVPEEVAYGTEYSTIQEVYDLIIGYGAWTENQGFIFDEFNNDFQSVINWEFTAREFLYWTTQNWADSSVITLSPFANQVKFQFQNSVVDNIFNSFYDYSILQANGTILPKSSISVNRQDGVCTINSNNSTDGIYFITLRNVQKEHALVFNNTTMFNDTIYDIETGYRQRRMKVSGFRTKSWDGDFFSPGFVYDTAKISNWEAFAAYKYGDVVEFAGKFYSAKKNVLGAEKFNFTEWVLLGDKPTAALLPNFDYKISQFEDFYSLDIDNFDAGQQQLAQHLVGYTPRVYLNNIFTNPIAQYKFYQGFIKEKGTKNSISKLAKASIQNLKGEITYNEEWAFRNGHYGSYETFNEVEVALKEGSFLDNPQVITFVDELPSNQNDLVYYAESKNLLLKPTEYIASQTFVTTSSIDIIKLPNAGYVRFDDIDSTAYNETSLLDIANVEELNEGDIIWLGYKKNGDWDVYRYTVVEARITSAVEDPDTDTIVLTTNGIHDLLKDDFVAISQFDTNVNGVYKVISVPALNKFTVESTALSGGSISSTVGGLLFKFLSVRYPSFDELPPDTWLSNLPDDTKVWIDDNGNGNWIVYEKVNNYTSTQVQASPEPQEQKLGWQISKLRNSKIFAVGATSYTDSFNKGNIFVYEEKVKGVQGKFRYGINSSVDQYCQSNVDSEFGNAIVYDPDTFADTGYGLFFGGAPAASFVNTGSGASTLINQGLVKVSSVDPVLVEEVSETILVSPNPSSNERFGHSLFLTETSSVKINEVLAEKYAVDVLNMIVNPGTEDYAYDINGDGSVDLLDITTGYLRLEAGLPLTYTPNPNSNYNSLIWNAKTLLVGAPETKNQGTGKVYKFNVYTTSTTSTVHIKNVSQLTTSTISVLSTGSRWGQSISGSFDGSTVAVSAPGYWTSTGLVVVYSGTNQIYSQTIESPFGKHSKFGDTVLLNRNGNYLFVTAPESRPTDQSFGKVAVYKKDNNKFNLLQILSNPVKQTGMKFGQAIDVNDDASELVISALGSNKNIISTFDKFSLLKAGAEAYVNDPLSDLSNDQTTFDSDSTTFYDSIVYSGSAYVFSRQTNLFRYAQELKPSNISTGTNFGYSVAVNDNSIYIGSPSFRNKFTVESTASSFTQFYKDDITVSGWKKLRTQDNLVDVDTIQKVSLIDNFNEEVIDYLDVIDPLKGKIAGIADQDLRYKSMVDPAVYSIGTELNVVDPDTCWLDEHVGELWWDLSTVKFTWYEQGEATYRKNNWGRVFPGSTVDIYEWVGSELLPSEWSALADTVEGLADGISGEPKHPDNSVLAVKQVYNSISNSFSNYYYYWVKNKVTIPNTKNRRISAFQVSSSIADPKLYGLKYAAILSENSVVLANAGANLLGETVSLNVSSDTINNNIPRHTEWLLLEENSSTGVPNTLLEKKLFDSLLGRDKLGNPVPDPTLPVRARYGVGIRPRQTLFKDRFAALRTLIEFANEILIKNQIVGNYDLSKFTSQELPPDVYSREFDQVVEDNEGILLINVNNISQAELSCTVYNGRIRSVSILNSGFGYKLPPRVTITSESGSDGEVVTEIDELGRIIAARVLNPGSGYVTEPLLTVRPFTVIVLADSTYNGKWAKYIYNKTNKIWVRAETQKYNTALYWDYVDWTSEDYNQFVDYDFVIDQVYELETLDINEGQYVKVKDGGLGNFIILEKVNSTTGTFSPGYNLLYSQNGTLQIKDSLWNVKNTNTGFDQNSSYDQTLYGQTADIELENILLGLKEDIFINDLKINWNKFFFTAVKYALSEQKLLDWAFKTSFINVTNLAGSLDQRPVYKLQNTEYFEDYIREVKPYHTQIRTFNTLHKNLETSKTYTTDFDLPAIYDKTNNQFSTINLEDSLVNNYPWKSWADNYRYGIESIAIADFGSGYTTAPTVEIIAQQSDIGFVTTATAKAYIRSGAIYDIKVTNPGKGYTLPPTIQINGSPITPAKAYARLGNGLVRSAKIGMKFDRITRSAAVEDLDVQDTFICNGSQKEFVLNWLANADKNDFSVTLDGSYVLSSNYTLEYYTETVDGYSKRRSKLVFKSLPREGQVLRISYVKNINLLSAAERISKFYKPNPGMPGNDLGQLMSGVVYPRTKLEGLPFDYTTKWDVQYTLNGNQKWASKFDETIWADEVDFYTDLSSTSLPINIGNTQSSVSLTTTTGIVKGLYVNVISTTSMVFNTATVRVVDIVTATNTVKFNSTVTEFLTTGTKFEFWSYNSNSSILDSAVDGGDLDYSNAAGVNPEDIIIVGDGFITPRTSYAPEELVPGEVHESLGINVYTKSPQGAPLVLSYYFDVTANTTATKTLSVIPASAASILVSFNNKLLTYNTTTNFVTIDEFSINWETNEIIVPPQPNSGKLGYTIVSVGGGSGVEAGLIDTASNSTLGYSSATVQSLSHIDSVASVYVTLNGATVPLTTSTAQFGYMLAPFSENSNRAAVTVYNINTSTTATVTAWFFSEEAEYFNEVNEQVILLTTSTITLAYPPANIEPVVAQTIIELDDGTNKKILRPPHVDYYEVTNPLITTYKILNNGVFNLTNVRVYLNGAQITAGSEWTVAGTTVSILIPLSVLDVIAIVSLPTGGWLDYDYDVVGNTLSLTSLVSLSGELRIITYTNHDDMLIRTERFDGNPNRRYKTSRPVLNDNYVWVILNGIPLVNRYDYEILEDKLTIQISDRFENSEADDIVITSISSSLLATKIIGFRLFNDIFNRTHFKRLSKQNSTYLTQPLNLGDTQIYVADSSVLTLPEKEKNIPGIVLIDGERIEFFNVNGNVLSQLRRGTLGTAPSFFSDVNTKVIDQGSSQTVPFTENIYRQDMYTEKDVYTYDIKTSSHILNTGTYEQFVNDGITLSTTTNAADQISVYYGGRPLNKVGTVYQDLTKSFDSPDIIFTNTNILGILSTSTTLDLPVTDLPGTAYIVTATNEVWVYTGSTEPSAVKGYVYKGLNYRPAEFTVNTATQQITLNMLDGVHDGIKLTVIKRDLERNRVWNTEVNSTTTLSLLDSNTVQARFLQARPAELPDNYYYGGDSALTLESGFALTDEDGEPLEGL